MKKRILNLLLISFMVVCFFVGSSSVIFAETSIDVSKINPVRFRVTSHLTPSHILWTDFYKPMFDQIEEETNGKVKFNVFLSQELVGLGDEAKALKDGVVDMAAPIAPTYEQSKMPLGEVTLLPLIDSDPVIGAKAWALMVNSDRKIKDGKTYSQIMFEENGLKVFAPTISDKYNLSTVGINFDTVESIKGMKVRSAARGQQIYAEKIGASSISMPAADLFDALSRNTLDGAFLWVSDWPSFGLQELFEYSLTGVNLGHFPSVFAMTTKKWNSMQPELRKLISQKVNNLRVPGAEAITKKYEKVRKDAEGKTEFIDINNLDDEVKAHLKSGLSETWMEYIDIMNSEGHPGKEIVKLWRDSIIEAGGEVPEEIKNLE